MECRKKNYKSFPAWQFFFAICEILSGSNFEEINEHLKFIQSPEASPPIIKIPTGEKVIAEKHRYFMKSNKNPWQGEGGEVDCGDCGSERLLVTRAERKNLITIFRYKFAPRGSCFDRPIKCLNRRNHKALKNSFLFVPSFENILQCL